MKRLSQLLLSCILVGIFAPSVWAENQLSRFRFPVTKHKLSNGLMVIFHEDHSVPMVSLHTWFRVGSRNEEPGYTGIAHLFEHLMFKGAKRYSGKDFDRVLNANGVSNNAFTTHDYTGYFQDAPSNKLELILDVESDRMENLKIDADGLKSEREVVKEERRMRVENSVMGIMNEAMWGTAFTKHPYSWPVIGHMKDLDAISLEKCQEFYKTFYSPANATLVLVGDFDSAKALKLIEKYYGNLRKIEIAPPKIEPEPEQTAPREKVVKKAAEAKKLLVGYRVSAQGHPDSYVMDLVANILGEGPSSRLYKKLVYTDQLATAVAGFNYTPKDPGLFNILIDLKPNANAEKALSLLDSEVQKIKTNVTSKELDKAKNQMMKQWVDAVSTVHGKGRALALNEVVTGSYENLFNDLDKYQRVTVSDIKRVAAKYLKPQRRSIVRLEPLAKGGLQ